MGRQAAITKLSKGDLVLDRLNWRYAAKAYDKTKKVSEADLRTLEESILLAPSSFGIQPYKVFVISDPDIREKLSPAAYNQPAVTDASHLIVFAYKKTLTETDLDELVGRIADVRNQTRESLDGLETAVRGAITRAVDSGSIETWNSRQAYIGLGFLLETAAMLEIDATPMEGFDPNQVNEILGLSDYSSVVMAAIGYRDASNDWLAALPKVRKPLGELIERI